MSHPCAAVGTGTLKAWQATSTRAPFLATKSLIVIGFHRDIVLDGRRNCCNLIFLNTCRDSECEEVRSASSNAESTAVRSRMRRGNTVTDWYGHKHAHRTPHYRGPITSALRTALSGCIGSPNFVVLVCGECLKRHMQPGPLYI